VPDTLSYAVYYGATRGMSAKELQKYDVIVTTYQTVVGDHNGSEEASGKKRKTDTGSLFGVPWKVRFPVLSSRSPIMKAVGSDVNPAYCPGRGP
jgi:hypothetical protein